MSLQKYAIIFGLCALMSMSGCASWFHNLHPRQLWKLNRGAALGRDTYNFSIPDEPMPAIVDEMENSEIEHKSHH